MNPRGGILPVLLAVLAACGCGDGSTKPPSPAPSATRGITITPRSFDRSDLLEFWDLAGQTGGLVAWYGDWITLADSANGSAGEVMRICAERRLTPVIAVQFFSQDSGQLLRPLDGATRALYRDSAVAFARSTKPPYFALGIEVNVLYEKSPEDFRTFADFYDEVYRAVKTVSPGTKIFPIFQLEKMQGMNGGLFGGVNDSAQAEWALLDLFPKSDAAAFTTYPSLVFGEPSAIPPGYYDAIRAHTSKPVAFTEIGWHAGAAPPGWESSEGEQAAAVDTFFVRSAALEPVLSIWSFLYDPPAPAPFNSMGLRRPDHSPRPAWTRWVANLRGAR